MYLEVDEGFFDHPKTLRLCGMLKDPNGWAYVLRLWRWACRCAPDGSLEGMTQGEIEIAAGYAALDGKLYAALASRFIDEKDGAPFALHDWMKHQGRSIKRMVSRSESIKASARERQKRKRLREHVEQPRHASVTLDESVTSRDVTHPVQASPDQSRPDPKTERSETADRSDPPPVLVFPARGKAEAWGLTEAFVSEAKAAFPNLDVMGEFRKALAKVKTGAVNAKTERGYPKFLMGWLTRTNDNGPPRTGAPPRENGAQAAPIQRPRADPYCDAHSSFGRNLSSTKPSFSPKSGCPGCQEYKARHAGRSSEPTGIGDLFGGDAPSFAKVSP